MSGLAQMIADGETEEMSCPHHPGQSIIVLPGLKSRLASCRSLSEFVRSGREKCGHCPCLINNRSCPFESHGRIFYG